MLALSQFRDETPRIEGRAVRNSAAPISTVTTKGIEYRTSESTIEVKQGHCTPCISSVGTTTQNIRALFIVVDFLFLCFLWIVVMYHVVRRRGAEDRRGRGYLVSERTKEANDEYDIFEVTPRGHLEQSTSSCTARWLVKEEVQEVRGGGG